MKKISVLVQLLIIVFTPITQAAEWKPRPAMEQFYLSIEAIFERTYVEQGYSERVLDLSVALEQAGQLRMKYRNANQELLANIGQEICGQYLESYVHHYPIIRKMRSDYVERSPQLSPQERENEKEKMRQYYRSNLESAREAWVSCVNSPH